MAENLGVKNYNWDKKDGLVVPESRVCYNSYYYPVEDDKFSILDKIKVHGDEIAKYCDGGSALHLNLECVPTKEQAEQIILLCMKYGVPYYCYNALMSSCDSCGYVTYENIDTCPKCKGKEIQKYTRVIGYLVPISKMSDTRQKEAGVRYYHKEK